MVVLFKELLIHPASVNVSRYEKYDGLLRI